MATKNCLNIQKIGANILYTSLGPFAEFDKASYDFDVKNFHTHLGSFIEFDNFALKALREESNKGQCSFLTLLERKFLFKLISGAKYDGAVHLRF